MKRSDILFFFLFEDAQGNPYESYVGLKNSQGEVITPKLMSGKHVAFLRSIFKVPTIYLPGDELKIVRYTAH